MLNFLLAAWNISAFGVARRHARGMADSSAPEADLPSGDTLYAWRDWWIEARCECHVAYLPCRRLAADHGRGRRVAEVTVRLRCPRCRKRPSVAMVDDPRGAGGGGAYPAARRVPVPVPECDAGPAALL